MESLKKQFEQRRMRRAYYSPTKSMEWFDGHGFYDCFGDPIPDPKEYINLT